MIKIAGKNQKQIMKALYNLDIYASSNLISKKSKIKKPYNALMGLKKNGLITRRSGYGTGYQYEFGLTQKGYNYLKKNKLIKPKGNKKYDRWG